MRATAVVMIPSSKVSKRFWRRYRRSPAACSGYTAAKIRPFHRSRVPRKAADKNVDGGLVVIENFDETLRDLVQLLNNLDTTTLDAIAVERAIWSPATRPGGNRGFPVVRLDTLELKSTPSVCRRVNCNIGGQAEVAALIEQANFEVLATRARAGVLAFGADTDVRSLFSPHGITEFDLHPIEVRRLRYGSQERGLLRQALSRALARAHGFMVIRRHNTLDLMAPGRSTDQRWMPLKKLVGALSGVSLKSRRTDMAQGYRNPPRLGGRSAMAALRTADSHGGCYRRQPRRRHRLFARADGRRYNKQLNELIPLGFAQDSQSTHSNNRRRKALKASRAPAGRVTMHKFGPGSAFSGTWPMRTELSNRMIGSGTNALASSIILVCRPRNVDALTATRREFVVALKAELPSALRHLQAGNIAPVDLAQAAIGPGMGIYTRYERVLDAAGKPVSVRAMLLPLLTRRSTNALAEQEGDFDADSRWALAWFEQYGFAEGEYGMTRTPRRPKNTSVAGLAEAGIRTSAAARCR